MIAVGHTSRFIFQVPVGAKPSVIGFRKLSFYSTQLHHISVEISELPAGNGFVFLRGPKGPKRTARCVLFRRTAVCFVVTAAANAVGTPPMAINS